MEKPQQLAPLGLQHPRLLRGRRIAHYAERKHLTLQPPLARGRRQPDSLEPRRSPSIPACAGQTHPMGPGGRTRSFNPRSRGADVIVAKSGESWDLQPPLARGASRTHLKRTSAMLQVSTALKPLYIECTCTPRLVHGGGRRVRRTTDAVGKLARQPSERPPIKAAQLLLSACRLANAASGKVDDVGTWCRLAAEDRFEPGAEQVE